MGTSKTVDFREVSTYEGVDLAHGGGGGDRFTKSIKCPIFSHSIMHIIIIPTVLAKIYMWKSSFTLKVLSGPYSGGGGGVGRPPLFGDRKDFNQAHCSGNWLNLNFYICNFSVAPKLWILHLFFSIFLLRRLYKLHSFRDRPSLFWTLNTALTLLREDS